MDPRSQLWDLVREIPPGKVMAYSDLGRLLNPMLTGRMVGRCMANCPEDIPWWRVVAKDGSFPIDKRGPFLQNEQVARLTDEGVTFRNGKVDMRVSGL